VRVLQQEKRGGRKKGDEQPIHDKGEGLAESDIAFMKGPVLGESPFFSFSVLGGKKKGGDEQAILCLARGKAPRGLHVAAKEMAGGISRKEREEQKSTILAVRERENSYLMVPKKEKKKRGNRWRSGRGWGEKG